MRKIFNVVFIFISLQVYTTPLFGQLEIAYNIDYFANHVDEYRIKAVKLKVYFEEILFDQLVVDTLIYLNPEPGIRKGYFYWDFKESCNCRSVKYFINGRELKIPMIWDNKQETRIEVVTIFKDNGYGSVVNSENIAKKIYMLPDSIVFKREWDPKMGESPRYSIQNGSGHILHGQMMDNAFEGILYKKVDGIWQRLYTGYKQHKRNPEKPLHKSESATSLIRDSREADQIYKIQSSGEYRYQVYLGFDHYEESTIYGRIPIKSYRQSGYPRNIFREYFEVVDYFTIE